MTTTVVAAALALSGGAAVNVRGARYYHVAIRTLGLIALIFAIYTLAAEFY